MNVARKRDMPQFICFQLPKIPFFNKNGWTLTVFKFVPSPLCIKPVNERGWGRKGKVGSIGNWELANMEAPSTGTSRHLGMDDWTQNHESKAWEWRPGMSQCRWSLSKWSLRANASNSYRCLFICHWLKLPIFHLHRETLVLVTALLSFPDE